MENRQLHFTHRLVVQKFHFRALVLGMEARLFYTLSGGGVANAFACSAVELVVDFQLLFGSMDDVLLRAGGEQTVTYIKEVWTAASDVVQRLPLSTYFEQAKKEIKVAVRAIKCKFVYRDMMTRAVEAIAGAGHRTTKYVDGSPCSCLSV